MASACGIRGEDKAKTVAEHLKQSQHITKMRKQFVKLSSLKADDMAKESVL